MKKKVRAVSTIICVCLFVAMALGSGSSSSSASKVGEISSASTESKTSNKSETSAKTETSTVNEEKNVYYVGETFENSGLQITYVKSGEYVSDNEFLQPADGNKYIRLLFHVDNQSSSDQSVTVYSFNCYADGYECSATYRDDDLSASLSSGRSSDGAVYFEVPKEAKEIEIEYDYDLFSNKKVKFIYEGEKDSGLTFEKNTSVSESAFHVGDIIETKDIRIKYLKAAEYVSDNMFLKPGDGNKYVYIELEVENLSSTDHTISYFSFECYADGVNCKGFYGMDDALSATLSSGRKAKGTVAFEVPKDASVIEFEYEDNIWTSDKIVFLYE